MAVHIFFPGYLAGLQAENIQYLRCKTTWLQK